MSHNRGYHANIIFPSYYLVVSCNVTRGQSTATCPTPIEQTYSEPLTLSLGSMEDGSMCPGRRVGDRIWCRGVQRRSVRIRPSL